MPPFNPIQALAQKPSSLTPSEDLTGWLAAVLGPYGTEGERGVTVCPVHSLSSLRNGSHFHPFLPPTHNHQVQPPWKPPSKFSAKEQWAKTSGSLRHSITTDLVLGLLGFYLWLVNQSRLHPADWVSSHVRYRHCGFIRWDQGTRARKKHQVIDIK